MLKKSSILIIILVVVGAILACCMLIPVLLESFFAPLSYAPEQNRLREVETMVRAVAAVSDTAMPDDFPYANVLGNACWEFLRQKLEAHSNQYELIVAGIFGYDGTPMAGGTGTTVVVIHVVFPDGNRAAFDFYAFMFEGCRVLSDEQILKSL